ncbi:hypothetical protein EAI_05611 [Harpegnathos saltator]|uniref:Uncharacterized protein n=1 Tax=Harpegnathos saltator TaxID=610380 RepID=E2C7A2_HARSA|nr:hypothetical protein EAI_05611 [Harpegnathos saltator]
MAENNEQKKEDVEQYIEDDTSEEGLLELAPTLGQRVHFAEGTNLRCREDPIPSDSEERLAVNLLVTGSNSKLV